MSRGGYIETENGTVAIERFFVHLYCYKPIHSHPWTLEWFKMERFQPKHKTELQNYLKQKSEGKTVVPPSRPPVPPKATGTKNKQIKKQTKKKARRSRI